MHMGKVIFTGSKCHLSRIHPVIKLSPSQNMCKKKQFALYSLVVGVYYIIFQSFYNWIAYRDIFPYPDAHSFCLSTLLNFGPVYCIASFNVLLVFRFLKVKNKAYKVVLELLLSNAFAVLFNLLFLFVMAGGDYGYVDWAGTTLNNTFIWLIVELVYYFDNHHKHELEANLIKQQMMQYRYDVLKVSLNPHFLFNSLNILNSLLDQDVGRAKKFSIELSKTFRYMIQEQHSETVLLVKEMEFLESYASVLRTRYNDQLKFEITGKENIGAHQVVPYSLQLLVENICKHNVISMRQPMTVLVRIGESCLWVENVVRLKRTVSSSHFGLDYLVQLYAAHKKNVIIENDGHSFSVCIPYIV